MNLDTTNPIASRYTVGTRIFMSVVLVLGWTILIAALFDASGDLTPIWSMMFAAMAALWVLAAIDTYGRRLWLFEDRIMSRGLFLRTTVRFADVCEIRVGVHHLTVKSVHGESIQILSRMERYEEIVQCVYSTTGLRRDR